MLFRRKSKDQKHEEGVILKLKVTTPKGLAKKNLNKIKRMIIGVAKKAEAELIDDSTILFTVNCKNEREKYKIESRALMFGTMTKKVMKLTSKVLKKKLSKEDYETLKKWIEEETQVELIE